MPEETYKLIGDEEELKWFFDHVIQKPGPCEAYAFCMSSRNKKLTQEEREDIGQLCDEMLDPNIIIPDREGNWSYLQWVRGILRYEVPVMTYTTRGGHPFLQKSLVVYCLPNPSDEIKIISDFKAYLQRYEDDLARYAVNNSEGIKANALSMLRRSLTEFKRLQVSHTTRYWIDFDMDLSDLGNTMREQIYERWHELITDKVGKGNAVIVQTSGGFHTLVRKDTVHFNVKKMLDDFNKEHKDWIQEFKLNESRMLPTPGTLQYGNLVFVKNKEDF